MQPGGNIIQRRHTPESSFSGHVWSTSLTRQVPFSMHPANWHKKLFDFERVISTLT